MLRIDALKTQVEEYLQGIVDHIPLEDYCPETSLDNYRLKTINRLVRAYSLFDSDKKYKCDYYLALRDYLLIFDTSIQLDEFDSAIGSRFGIHKDPLSERFFASYSLPEYANGSFVKQAFLRGVSEPESPSRDDCDLSTDSMIYALTNYSTFKSLDQKLAVYGALNTPAGFTSLVSLPTSIKFVRQKKRLSLTLSTKKYSSTVVGNLFIQLLRQSIIKLRNSYSFLQKLC